MITKVYDKVVQFLKENFKFFCVLIVLGFLFTYEFPYYIDAPGGIMDVSDKIEIENHYKSDGSFNLAYVSELKATIPTLLLALINPDWDILKEQEVLYNHETMKELLIRDQLLLEEALSNATIVGYKKKQGSVDIISEKVYVSYKTEEAITTLKVGDQILSVEGILIKNKEHLEQVLESLEVGKEFSIQVNDGQKQTTRKATLQTEENRKIIGIVITQISEIQTNPEIQFHFKKNESGPSGGLMTALSIYNMMIEEDLTKGYKIVGTGTIDPDGNIGEIGGIKYKLKGAVKKKADLFLVPTGANYEEAIEEKKKHNYTIKIVPVSTFEEAIQYLKQLEKV